jgi:hypothetical protein
MSEAIPVTASTAGKALAGLPLTARLTLLFVARLRRGTLEVSLPNGRRLRFGGIEPGPAAVMIINDLGFGRRFIGGGDIGIAEAYLRAMPATGATSRMKLKLSFSYSVALMASFEPDKSSVYPSAGACTTASTAILPLPPVRFSMRNCRPSRSDSNCPIKRAMMSYVPPAAKPTMMWTGRAG